MTFAQWQSLNPGVPVSGFGRFLLVCCGHARRFESLPVAKTAKLDRCGETCAGPDNHAGWILDADWRPSKWFRQMVADD